MDTRPTYDASRASGYTARFGAMHESMNLLHHGIQRAQSQCVLEKVFALGGIFHMPFVKYERGRCARAEGSGAPV